MPVVGEAAIVVDADTAPFDRDLKNNVTKSATGAGSIIKGILGAAFIQAGARAGVDLFKSAIDGASDLQESLGKVRVVFGDSSKDIEKFASGSAKAFGQSKQQALEAAGTFGNLAVSIGLPVAKAAAMSKSLVTLGADLASFNNTSVDEALNALRSGLTGETEPLKRFGIALDDATLRQKALELGLTKTTKEVLPPAIKAQASYALIMDRSKTAQGDFARTSDGLANKQRILAAQITDLKTRFGSALLPVVSSVTGFLVNKMIPAFESIGEVVKAAFSVLRGSDPGDIVGPKGPFRDFLNTLFALMPVIDAVTNTVKNLFAGFGGTESEFVGGLDETFFNFGQTLRTVASFVQDNLKPILIGLGAAALVIAGPFIALGAAFVIAYTKSQTFRDIVQDVVTQVTGFVSGLVAFVQTNMPKFQEAFSHVANAVIAIFNQFKGTVGPVIEAVVNTVIALVGRLVEHFKQVVLFFTNIINGDFAAAFGNLKNIVKNIIGAVLDIIKGLVPAIAGLAVGVLSALASLGRDIIAGLVRGIRDKAGDVIDAIKRFVLDKVPKFVKTFFGIGSPSKMFAGFGENLMQGLAQGIRDASGDPIAALNTAASRLNLGNGAFNTGTSGPGAVGPSRSVTIGQITVNEVESDPEATAFAVMSRIAAAMNL